MNIKMDQLPKFLGIFLIISLLALSINSATAEPQRFNISEMSVQINEPGDYIVTGESFSSTMMTDKNIKIGPGISVNLTLDNVEVSTFGMFNIPLDIDNNSKVNLILIGDNFFVGSMNNPGIKVPKSSDLTIKGAGKLTSVGNLGSPGIGGVCCGLNPVSCGNITIENGTVFSLGGRSSPGIGASGNKEKAGGTISIKGGNVVAVSGGQCPAIGSPQSSSVDDIKISGGTISAFGGDNDSIPAICVNFSSMSGPNIFGNPKIIAGNNPNVASSKTSYNLEPFVKLDYNNSNSFYVYYDASEGHVKYNTNHLQKFKVSDLEYIIDFSEENNFVTNDEKHFVTWKQNADLSGPSVFPGDVLTKETLLYAKYSDTPVYPLRYNLGDGVTGTVPEGEFKQGISVTLPELPAGISNPGHKFVGWKDVSSGTVYAPGKSFTMPDRSVTLSAVWDAILYNVTYDLNGGSGANAPVQQAVPSGTVFVVADLPQGIKNPGKKFIGWKDVSSGKIYMPSDRYEVGYSDTVLQAQWELSAPVYPEKTYWFFIQNDDRAYWINATSTGGPVGSLRQACSEAAFEVNISDNGWLTTLMNLGAVETTNGTWTYWLTFNRADNEWVYSSTTIADMINEDYFAFVYGATDGMTYQPLTTPNAPAKDGFVFDGYYMDPEFENSYDFSVMPTEEAQLYVKWKTKNPDLPILNPGAETPSLIDVLLLLQYTAGVGMYKDKNDTDMINLGADLDQDGQINLSDVLLFLKRL